MEAVRYSLDLKGYMIRAVSQYQREWSRISREAVQSGFSFEVLGSALREEYLKKSYIHAVEFLFVTSSAGDVSGLQEITKNVGRTINALNKMLSEIDPDCDECEYNDVCDEVDELKSMRKTRDKKRMNTNG
jgi:CO dehydrogenase/acetyl-CoA synthase beta subunit